MSRQLPTPPGLPACAIPKITCCPWANDPSPASPSTPSSTSSSLSSASASASSSTNSDIDLDSEGLEYARFLAEVAPFLLFPAEENNPDHDEKKSQDPDAPEPPAAAGSSNMMPLVPQDDAMIMSGSQTEEIRHAAADRRFLEELGLTPQDFMALLDGTGVEWDDDDDDDDEEEGEEEEEGGEGEEVLEKVEEEEEEEDQD